MWGAVFRQVFAYLLTRRGKRALAFVGMLLLGFVTALLLDMQLYISASFTGCLAVVLITMWLVQYWRVKQHDRLREMRRVEAAAKRLVAAQERSGHLVFVPPPSPPPDGGPKNDEPTPERAE